MTAARSYLIVDDNRAFAENIAEILTDAGAQTQVASSGAEALEAVRNRRFSAVLTDMKMPVMSGAQVVHDIRRIDPGIPALVMTAYTGDNDLEAARSEGLFALLPKPVPMATLLQLLESARRDALVAVVEDDESLRDNLSEALRGRGFTAVLAGSVIEADRLGCVRPFAALVDLRLPDGADGEALKKLEERYPGIPMVVITAHSDTPLPFSTAAFFRKPFSTEQLLSKLDELHASANR